MGPRNRSIVAAAVVSILLSVFPAATIAESPTGEIRGAIDRVISILNRKELQPKAKREERRALLRAEIQPVFDFGEMAKRSLGARWRERTPEEKDRFVKLFTELLETSYLGKIESYKGEKIRYVKESLDPPYAEVNTLIVTTKEQEIPVDYRLLRAGERWRIYDVVIEGISLVNNYRSQFDAILQRSSFDELVAKLRSTVEQSRSKGP